MLGIVPGSGSIAIPVSKHFYEDNLNMINPELYAFDLTGNVLTIPVMNPGTLTFIYGRTPVTFDFKASGIYNVTFSEYYNSIINVNQIMRRLTYRSSLHQSDIRHSFAFATTNTSRLSNTIFAFDFRTIINHCRNNCISNLFGDSYALVSREIEWYQKSVFS